MKKMIVTGANGFIGSSLIKKLIAEGISVVALDISFSPSNLPENDNIIKLETNLDRLENMLTAIPLDEYDAFYHLAWKGVNGSSKADPIVQAENVQTALRCAELAKQIGCQKFLCAGTIAERSIESLPALNKASGGMMYGVAKHSTHLMLEAYCKNVGLDFVWMQFSNIYGPQNKTGNLISYTLNELSESRNATFGPATQPYDFVFIDDLLEAVYRLGTAKTTSNFYFIGSGKPRILKDYLIEIGEAYGRADLIKLGERPDDGIVYRFEMFDTSSLVSDIGDYVSVSFSDGIRYTIAHY